MHQRQSHVRRPLLIALAATALACHKAPAPSARTDVELTDPSGPTSLHYAIARRDPRGNGRVIFLSEKPVACEDAKPRAEIVFSLFPGPPDGYDSVLVDARVTTRVKQESSAEAIVTMKPLGRSILISEDWARVHGIFNAQDCPDVVEAEPQPRVGATSPLSVTVPGNAPLHAEGSAFGTWSVDGMRSIAVSLGGKYRLSMNLLGAHSSTHRALTLTPQPVQVSFWDGSRFSHDAYGWIRFLEFGTQFKVEVGVRLRDHLEVTGVVEGAVVHSDHPSSAWGSAPLRANPF